MKTHCSTREIEKKRSECVCVCVRKRERERERERERDEKGVCVMKDENCVSGLARVLENK